MENLKRQRIKCGLSQQELANRVDMSQQSIYQYENGINQPSIETLILLAQKLGTTIDYLVGNTEYPYCAESVAAFPVSEDEKELVQNYRSLSSEQKRDYKKVVEIIFRNI